LSGRLEVLSCDKCGAPVPLASDSATTCPRCSSEVAVPEAHRALHDERQELREDRAQAEVAWKKLPRALPEWLGLGVAVWPIVGGAVATVVLPVVALINNWFGLRDLDAEGWKLVIMGLVGVLFFWVLLILDLFVIRLTYGYDDEMRSYAALEREGGAHGCRVCGAPLFFREQDLAATCDYCGADSVLVRLSWRTRSRLDAAKREAKTSLKEAVSQLQFIRGEQGLFRIIAWSVFGACYLVACCVVL
jgi:uncharacterized Zn finger protein (UPF0148 family)